MDGELDKVRKSPWFGNAAQRAELRMKVWDLRKNGYTHREVGDALGISKGFVATLETEYLDDIPATARDAHRAAMEERLGEMQRHVVDTYANTGDWNAFKAYQWIEERRAKLLGLDAPLVTKSEVTNVDPLDGALQDLVAEARMAEEEARAKRSE